MRAQKLSVLSELLEGCALQEYQVSSIDISSNSRSHPRFGSIERKREMNIQIIYTNGRGKRIVKDFSDPMDVIGYIYRCYATARNAASIKRVNAMLDERMKKLNLEEEA